MLDLGYNGGVPTIDQRGAGFSRIINTTVDIGAVELQTTTPSVVSNTNDSGAGSLRQAGTVCECLTGFRYDRFYGSHLPQSNHYPR